MNFNGLSEDDLNEKKKRAKNELKNYDTSFQTAFKRFPNRDEKEPMRPLYIYYKMLKQALDKQGSTKGNDQNMEEKLIERLVNLKNQRNELRSKLEVY